CARKPAIRSTSCATDRRRPAAPARSSAGTSPRSMAHSSRSPSTRCTSMGNEDFAQRFADALGRDALSVFLLAFAALLAAVLVVGRWSLTHSRVADSARIASITTLLVRVAAGFFVVIAAGGLFAAVAGEIGVDESLGRFDVLTSAAIAKYASA